MACTNCDDHHIVYHDIEDADGEQKHVITFPREPSWWRDNTDDAEQQRQHVFRDFDQAELVTLIDEVWMYIQNPPETADEVAQLVRRLLSLTWMADICVGSLNHVDEDDQVTYWVRYWMQRAAKYIANAAWRVVVISPVNVVGNGFTDAARSEIEFADADNLSA